ncbi:hypothetical protein AN964_12430 [Heyndrickxia shackletonii]|uniref:Uncharacterized protein n=2 Tax=Heyndrickxia TaxID=2837504 RepID=A0A0Q3WXD6_9BACI|nr:hypothetical protein [Heyndrickxia shackletonii]KQL54220.1 hypothetical protein AN964_12430 [Heyndrickxia shackletonii]NEZ00899.1 hypothetical protein [Heyndrickxia shackletonii]
MKKTLAKLSRKIFDIFNYLHQNPEVSWKEVNTTSYIANILKENGCLVTTFPDHTGVVGEIGDGPVTVHDPRLLNRIMFQKVRLRSFLNE